MGRPPGGHLGLVRERADTAQPSHAFVWMTFGLCRDMDPAVFFPHDNKGTIEALAICAQCPVREACLEYALRNHMRYGVWGGTSERERNRLQRQRRSA